MTPESNGIHPIDTLLIQAVDQVRDRLIQWGHLNQTGFTPLTPCLIQAVDQVRVRLIQAGVHV
jgi:hypothetical protein